MDIELRENRGCKLCAFLLIRHRKQIQPFSIVFDETAQPVSGDAESVGGIGRPDNKPVQSVKQLAFIDIFSRHYSCSRLL